MEMRGNYRDFGFFVIRRGDQLLALSAICTHRKCKLYAEPDSSFYCKCHGSTFDPCRPVCCKGPAFGVTCRPCLPLRMKKASWSSWFPNNN